MSEKSGLETLISVFVHYQEINSVKYEAAEGRLKIEVAVKNVDEQTLAEFKNRLYDCLYLYHKFSRVKPVLFDVKYANDIGITFLRYYRDINTLSEGEVELFILLLKEYFNSALIVDETNYVDYEETYAREIKSNLLHNQKSGDVNSKNIFAYRDHGTMFVFNK